MADIELVIKVSEDDYEKIKWTSVKNGAKEELDYMRRLILSGVPLPKGHKRIIDEGKIKTVYYHIETSASERFRLEHIVIDGTDAPTIIEGSDE